MGPITDVLGSIIPSPRFPSSHYKSQPGIHIIPTELMTMIFAHCMPQGTYITPRKSDSPILLTQVCRRWRQVALSTPQFWIALQITASPQYGWTDIIETWLPRAGKVPVALRITELTYISALYLTRFLPQLGRLELQCSESLLDRQPFPPTNLPHLKSLDVTINGLNGWHEWLASIMAAAPNLESILWAGANTTSPPVHIFNNQLRHISIMNPILFDSLIEIINLCTNAETLRFTIAALGSTEPTVIPTSEIHLPNLVHLELGYDFKGHSAQLRMLLNLINASRLERVAIAAFDWPQRPLLNLFERSRCSIRSLQCTGSDIWNCQIIECLGHPCVSSTIETFIIAGRGYCVDDKVLKALSFDEKTRSCVAPRLRNVKFTGELNTGQDVWDKMNQSRVENGYPSLINAGEKSLTFKRAASSLSFMFYPGFTSQTVVKSGQSDTVRVYRRMGPVVATDGSLRTTTTYEFQRSSTEEQLLRVDRRPSQSQSTAPTSPSRNRLQYTFFSSSHSFATTSAPSTSSSSTSPSRKRTRYPVPNAGYSEDDFGSDLEIDDEPYFGPTRFFFTSQTDTTSPVPPLSPLPVTQPEEPDHDQDEQGAGAYAAGPSSH